MSPQSGSSWAWPSQTWGDCEDWGGLGPSQEESTESWLVMEGAIRGRARGGEEAGRTDEGRTDGGQPSSLSRSADWDYHNTQVPPSLLASC